MGSTGKKCRKADVPCAPVVACRHTSAGHILSNLHEPAQDFARNQAQPSRDAPNTHHRIGLFVQLVKIPPMSIVQIGTIASEKDCALRTMRPSRRHATIAACECSNLGADTATLTPPGQRPQLHRRRSRQTRRSCKVNWGAGFAAYSTLGTSPLVPPFPLCLGSRRLQGRRDLLPPPLLLPDATPPSQAAIPRRQSKTRPDRRVPRDKSGLFTDAGVIAPAIRPGRRTGRRVRAPTHRPAA